MRVALTSGYDRSLHAVALLHQLAARGHELVCCLSVREWNISRLRFYLRQLGPRRFAAKLRAKWLTGGRASGPAGGEVAPMLEYLERHGIVARRVSQACRMLNVRRVGVASLNSPAAIEVLRAARPDVIVYAGGGIVRQEFLDVAPHGVLNAHGGPLPRFRGMNAGEWALWHGVAPAVTVLRMDAGIDTGPILLSRPVPVDAWREIPRGRGESTRVSVEALLEAVDELAAGRLVPQSQEPAAGRQYFVMAEPLLEVLERRIAAGWLPSGLRSDEAGEATCATAKR